MSRGTQLPHLELEEIAALIDDGVASGDRARQIAHLADCVECYEIFSATGRTVLDQQARADAGTVPPQEGRDDGKLLRPHASRWRRRTLLAVPAIAAAGLLVALLLPGRAVLKGVGELTAPLADPSALARRVSVTWQDNGWDLERGTGTPLTGAEQLAFQLGVRVTEIEIALSAGAADLAANLSQDLARRATTAPESHELLLLYDGQMGIRGQLAAGRPPRELLALNRIADERLVDRPEWVGESDVNPFWYQLGKWSRAVELAAAAGDADYLSRPFHRRFLREALSFSLPLPIAARLRRVQELVGEARQEHLVEIESEAGELIALAGGGELPESARAPE